MIINKLEEISFIKTIVMIIIVFYHSCLFFGGTWFTFVNPVYSANYLYVFAKWLNTFHIHTFVMASGFLFYYLKIEKNKYNNYKQDIMKRFKRLIIPYIFTSMFWVIPISLYFFKYNFKEIFDKYVLCISPGQLWFLIMLFLVFILFEFLSNKIKISKMNLIIIYIVFTLLFGIIEYLNIDYFQLPKVFEYSVFFYLGGYLYKFRNSFNYKKIIFIIIGIIILLLSNYLIDDKNIIFKILKIYLSQLLSILEVIIIYVIGNYLINKKKIKINNKIYKLFESSSFGIYLFHQQIIYFCIVLLNGLVHPIMQVIITFIISISISLVMSLLLKKNNVTKVMFGL